MIGIILVFISSTSAVGLAGESSSGGQLFDYVYLQHTVVAFLIGILIGLCVNILVFPDFAEHHLNDKMELMFRKLGYLSSACVGCLVNTDVSREAYIANTKLRHHLVSEIQHAFCVIDATIDQASVEITWSHFSMKDYALIARQCKSVTAVLCSIHTVLSSPETLGLVLSPEYQRNLTSEMKLLWNEFDGVCTRIFRGLRGNMANEQYHGTRESDMLINDLERTAATALSMLVAQQADVFTNILAHAGRDLHSPSAESKNDWEKFVQLTFQTLATNELVKELTLLHKETNTRAQEDRRVRFHFNWLVPLVDFLRQIRAHCTFSMKKTTATAANEFLVKAKDLLLSDSSVYGCKVATAVLCLQLVMYLNPHLFRKWFFIRTLAPIVVAVSPSLGQTYLSLGPRILGTSAGASLAYGSVVLFGQASPMHIITDIPQSDPPQVYLYKLVTVTSLALCFSVIFTLVIYPVRNFSLNLLAPIYTRLFKVFARRRLRARMSSIFRKLNVFYRHVISDSNRAVRYGHPETKDLRNTIFSALVSLEPLMKFSVAEPRLEGKFQYADYRNLINCMYRLLDRLECLRLCIGDSPFDADIKRVLRFGEYGQARLELHRTIRILLYVFSSTMLTKLSILPNLPNAIDARTRMIHGFIAMLLEHSQPHEFDGSDPLDGAMPLDKNGMLEALKTEKWVHLLGMSISLREVSRALDEIVDPMKLIFGEAPDILDPEEEADTPFIVST
ncbi:hypothetical protein HDU98_001029 [Podochytrium sp. JEL0797]|nr:hypothetical protein HDU98_001029 [Podochytrium sp. JEL0797]